MDFCFVHAADLHLDTPFEGVGETAPELAERLRDASLGALDQLVRLTIDRQAAFLLLAGDIYDGAERGIRAQFRFLDAMKRLDEKNIPVFIVHGNHDPLGGWSAIRQWPANVTIFPSDRVGAQPVLCDGKRLATIYGISYPAREVSDNLALQFQAQAAEGLHIGLLHANVGNVAEHGRYSPATAYDLARAGLHYWALGHIHARRVFQAGSAWAVYPGNTQGRSFKPSEQGPKGAMVVTASTAGIQEIHFHPIDEARFAEFSVDVSAMEDWAVLADALESRARAALEAAEGRDVVLRFTLAGRGPLHAELRDAARVQALAGELRTRTAEAPAAVHWAGISDQTRPTFDRETIRGRGDFAAELVSKADALQADPAAQEVFAAPCWNHPKAQQVRNWLPDPDRAERAELFTAAARRALELVLDRMEQEAEP